MALTPPVLDQSSQGSRWIRYTGGLGGADNDILKDVPCEGAIEVIAYSTTNTFDVYGCLDGTNVSAQALAMEDMTATAPGTRVIVSTADKPVRITNPGFKFLRFLQAGAGAPTNFSVAVRVLE